MMTYSLFLLAAFTMLLGAFRFAGALKRFGQNPASRPLAVRLVWLPVFVGAAGGFLLLYLFMAAIARWQIAVLLWGFAAMLGAIGGVCLYLAYYVETGGTDSVSSMWRWVKTIWPFSRLTK